MSLVTSQNLILHAIILILVAALFVVLLLFHDTPQGQPISFRQPQATVGATLDSPVEERLRRIYVPAYSHCYIGSGKGLPVAVTLTIHNTDPDADRIVRSVSYHKTDGSTDRMLMEAPIRLAPLASTSFLIEERDLSGGSGAKFLVHWQGPTSGKPLHAQSLMIGGDKFKTVSIVCPGIPID